VQGSYVRWLLSLRLNEVIELDSITSCGKVFHKKGALIKNEYLKAFMREGLQNRDKAWDRVMVCSSANAASVIPKSIVHLLRQDWHQIGKPWHQIGKPAVCEDRLLLFCDGKLELNMHLLLKQWKHWSANIVHACQSVPTTTMPSTTILYRQDHMPNCHASFSLLPRS